ncbi:hypothetical protein RvY_05990 [Ramazzottius varieornatus]|uniref:MYND-type domain-containing protein n=1 Tax=Ramazzottius varieornatus TaxID=947166 RepID=A0A1D1V0H0_RAMVA|nr:hypothetical protein RvY_05990 [Ramazzottius varieornatus]
MDFNVGDIIFQCDPWVFTVSAEEADNFCHRCLLELAFVADAPSLTSCSGCNFAKYCSKTCQDQDGWEEECGTTHRTFRSLISHQEEIEENQELMDKLLLFYEVLIGDNDSIQPISFNTFVEISGKLQSNAFGIVNDTFLNVGEGVYLGPSIMDHSCDRNATYHFDGPRITVVAIKPILRLQEALPWDERGNLPCENCGLVNAPTPHSEKATEVLKKLSMLHEERLLAEDESNHSLPKASMHSGSEVCGVNGALHEVARYLHPQNMLLGLTYELAARIKLDQQNLESKKDRKVLEEVVSHTTASLPSLRYEYGLLSSVLWTFHSPPDEGIGCRFFYSSFDIVIGMTLLTIGDFQHQLGKYDEAKASLKEARDIFGLIDGRTRPLYKTATNLLANCAE